MACEVISGMLAGTCGPVVYQLAFSSRSRFPIHLFGPTVYINSIPYPLVAGGQSNPSIMAPSYPSPILRDMDSPRAGPQKGTNTPKHCSFQRSNENALCSMQHAVVTLCRLNRPDAVVGCVTNLPTVCFLLPHNSHVCATIDRCF